MTEKKLQKSNNDPDDFDELETASDLESEFRTRRKIHKSRKKTNLKKGKPKNDSEQD